ncbi:hypothetical protein [Flagellimonas sp. CMM7]|uniref:hypothetical protein n=1 Tax=Flagellimonas sp. CMM7 TaxID=2654676 RepID=UPI0013D541E8|nr:hypothetical protein [Flagellimonas sp. CMM7]UII81115.1 hypothetical protein LV704_06265 [Flagellimonas sp. CMM7]
MKQVLISLSLFLLLFLFSCNAPKYSYSFEKGKTLDFNQGKWVMNKPHGSNNPPDIYDYSTIYFKEILGDSLIRLDELRNVRIVPVQFPFEMSNSDLKNAQIATKCDYLISINEKNSKNEMTGFVGSTNIGSATKTNEATIEIRIYDLNKRELISNSVVIGVDNRLIDEDHNWGQAKSVETITRVGLSKLINAYDKNKVK